MADCRTIGVAQIFVEVMSAAKEGAIELAESIAKSGELQLRRRSFSQSCCRRRFLN
jgi:hypothetical protein